MKANESTADRIIRIVLGAVLAALAITGVATGALTIVAWVLTALLLVTGVVGFCPLYAVLRFSTKLASR
jgi:hypothetical protein